ncbi:hypothetical protein BJX61DRAFT_527907 [Aspergillus egyptiacus]|nr:hypothetical protein BJX61DRAFT_527907 [Aspergillus egyptiacus]
MASGFGINGGPSRCFNFWQEVLGCYVVNAGEGESGAKRCKPALEDYYECLHHRKEALRTMKMQAAYRKAEASHPRELAPTAESVKNLGLLKKKNDEWSKEWESMSEEKKANVLNLFPTDKRAEARSVLDSAEKREEAVKAFYGVQGN